MPQDNFPPLRIRETDGNPNIIPVFDPLNAPNAAIVPVEFVSQKA